MRYDINTLEVNKGDVVVVSVKANYSPETVAKKAALIENALRDRLGHSNFQVVVMLNGEKVESLPPMDFQKKLGEGEFLHDSDEDEPEPDEDVPEEQDSYDEDK